jgi:hypothetical protein
MKNIEIIKNISKDCITEGEDLLKTKFVKVNGPFETIHVDLEGFYKWKSNCNVLINMIGNLSDPWNEIFVGAKENSLINTLGMIGGLKSINDSINKGYLMRIEDLIFAEAFSNLIEQAEYLLNQKYYLAAGVVGRAVLEEKLRNICDSQNITFTKDRPTLSDFNMQLYKTKFYDKIEHKNIDYLISIGNNSAHNQSVKDEDVKSMINGIKRVLIKYN